MLSILLLPVIFAVGGAACYTFVFWRFRSAGPRYVANAGGYIQLVLTVAVLVLYSRVLGTGGAVFTGPAVLSAQAAGWLVAAVAVGAACFGFELALGIAVHRFARRGGTTSTALVEGGSRALLDSELRPVKFVLLGIGLAVAEELLWRQLVIGWLRGEANWSAWSAVAVSAVLFGLNHYWFGLRNIVAKTVLGICWGWLLVASGSVVYATVAHSVFQCLVWHRLVRQQRVVTSRREGSHAHAT